MRKLSQRNPLWSWRKLGSCNTTIGQQGCTITCFAMLHNSGSYWVNKVLKSKGGYVSGCLVNWEPACKILGLKWHGRSGRAKFFPTIAEVRLGRSPHFVVFTSRNHIIDPWDRFPKEKLNTYRVYGYRNVKAKAVQLSPLQAYIARYVRRWKRLPTKGLIAKFLKGLKK